MYFSSNKFELMRHTARNTQIDFEHKTKDGEIITRNNKTIELGIIISYDAKLHDQNEKAAANGRGRAAWICRVFNTRGKHEILIIYKALFLPLLEYSSPLQNPSALRQIREKGNVQRSFTRRIEVLENLYYWEKLQD